MDVPMSNENTDLPIPILNETIVQSNPMPNEITGQSSYFTNETPSNYNQMPNEAIVHPILIPIQSCTKDLANDSDNDILPYPKIYAIKSKENRRKAQKYFVLTSQEAMQSKLNDEQKKKNKVTATEEKRLKKQNESEKKSQHQQEKEIQKLSKKANLVQKRRVNSIPMLKVYISSDNKKIHNTVSENAILSFDNTTRVIPYEIIQTMTPLDFYLRNPKIVPSRLD